MQDFADWKRIVAQDQPPEPRPGERRLYVPPVEPLGLLPYELAGLMPNRDHKYDLMALIDDLPPNRLGDRAVVGVFAADPFLNCKQIAVHLLGKGYSRVSNIPPVAGYGPEFLATMDNVQSGRVREQRTLTQMRQLGLTICPAVADLESLDAVMEWEPPFLWITASFEMWRRGRIDADLLLSLCSEVSARTHIPLVLVSGRTGIGPDQAQKAGASGMLSN